VGQRGLGRGLGALLPSEAAAAPPPTPTIGGPALREVPVDRLRPNPRQPRRAFDEEPLASLTASVAALGVLQPLLVRELGSGEYELIAGERRWRAAQRAGLPTVPVLVRQADDLASLEQAVVENLHRSDLNPLEEAAAYSQLLEDFALTHEQLAARVGRSRAAVSNTLRLLQLPAAIQRFLVEGTLTAGHARALLGSGDPAFQEALAARAVREGLSVRAVEEAVRAREGGTAAPPSTPRSPARRLPGFAELESLLAEHLATRVRVEEHGRRGRIGVEFADPDDLERIYRAMVEGASSPSIDT
jgi:ParB family transcriptional regulator, chromosome partitioning protein